MHLKIEKIWPRFPAFSLRSFLPRRLLGGTFLSPSSLVYSTAQLSRVSTSAPATSSRNQGNSMLKIGLFGVGRIGRMRARILAANNRVQLVGIYDVDTVAAASAATETGSVSVDSVDALLGDPTLDAVCISSSTSTHCDLIEGAAGAGKAVLCEKPIHLDMEAGGRLRGSSCRRPACRFRSDSTGASTRPQCGAPGCPQRRDRQPGAGRIQQPGSIPAAPEIPSGFRGTVPGHDGPRLRHGPLPVR